MSSKERRTVPIEAIEIYNQFIHGEISRREFLRGAKKFAVAGLSATAIVQALMPNYALGQQVARDDERIRCVRQDSGGKSGAASPDAAEYAPVRRFRGPEGA